MLPKRARLTRHDFQKLPGHGAVIHTPFFTLRAYRGTTPRYAVVVAKKVTSSAVVRHQVKRRLFEAVRTSGVAAPLSAVFYAKAPAVTASLPLLTAEVAGALARAAALK